MLAFFKNIYRILLQLIKPNVWILDGQEKSTNKSLKILYIGNKRDKSYIAKTVFNSSYKESYLGRKFFLQLYYIMSKNRYKCSLSIIEGIFIDRYIYRSMKDFFVPLWVDSVSDLPLLITKSSAKYEVRTIRKNKLEYIVTQNTKMFNDFYYNMHLPMIKDRYQDGAYEETYDDIMKRIKEDCCELLLIKKEDVFISGVILNRCEGIPQLWKNGILDIKYWKNGAMAATYVFGSDYLSKKGYEKVSYGLMRSFLNDGLLQYKKKWNIAFKINSRRGYILKPLNTSASVKGFFENNPFIYMEKNKLYGAVFINEDEQYCEEDFRKLQKKYDINGLSELNVFSIKENGTINLLGPLKNILQFHDR